MLKAFYWPEEVMTERRCGCCARLMISCRGIACCSAVVWHINGCASEHNPGSEGIRVCKQTAFVYLSYS
jgi:hypothetical protein